MKIEFKSTKPNELYAKPYGRIDTITAVDFGTSVSDRLDDVKKLLIDFAEVEYVSSMGLRVILDLQKCMNDKGEMVLTNVKSDVMKVFEITGFDDFLNII